MNLTLYMKSGNVVVIRGLKKYRIENEGNEITAISITYKHIPREKMLVKTIDMSQIEMITCTRSRLTTWWANFCDVLRGPK